MSTTEIFLIAMLIIFTVPYLIWRLCRTEYWAPLVVVQIITGILLGPGVLGPLSRLLQFVFTPAGDPVAEWHRLVGSDDLRVDRRHRTRPGRGLEASARKRDHGGLALGTAAALRLCRGARHAGGARGWMGEGGATWQFVLGVGMACAVTALPILILLMEKLDILRQPIGQRILRYASLDDVAIWGVLALILLDWTASAARRLSSLSSHPPRGCSAD